MWTHCWRKRLVFFGHNESGDQSFLSFLFSNRDHLKTLESSLYQGHYWQKRLVFFNQSIYYQRPGKLSIDCPLTGLHKFILGENDQSFSLLLFDSRDQSFQLILDLWRLVFSINYDLRKIRGFLYKLGFLPSLSWPFIVEQRVVFFQHFY